MLIGLPIPPHIACGDAVGSKWFGSLDFNFAQEKLVSVISQKCIESLPDLCAGILAFDIWIVNEDRHEENLVTDAVSAPTAMHVFDQGMGLFGGNKLQGPARLKAIRDAASLGCDNDGEIVQGYRHIFLDLINSRERLNFWVKRISEVPTWAIERACEFAVKELALSPSDSTGALQFLTYRRENLWSIMVKNQEKFSAIRTLEDGSMF